MIHYAKNWAILAGLDQSKEHKDSINTISTRMYTERQSVLAGAACSLVYLPEVEPGSSLFLYSFLLPATSEASSFQVLPGKNWNELKNWQLKSKPERWRSSSPWASVYEGTEAGVGPVDENKQSWCQRQKKEGDSCSWLARWKWLWDWRKETKNSLAQLPASPGCAWLLISEIFFNNEQYFFFAILSIKSIAKGYIHKHFLCRLHKQVIIALWYNKEERFPLTILHFMRSGWKSFSTYFLPLIFSATFQINKIEWWCLTTFLQFVSRDFLGMTSFSISESQPLYLLVRFMFIHLIIHATDNN